MNHAVLALLANNALILGTIIFFRFRHPRKTGKELVILRETWLTMVLAVFLFFLCEALPISGLAGPKTGEISQERLIFSAVFSCVCSLTGCFAFLFTFLKQAIAYDDKTVIVDSIGRKTIVKWTEITRAERSLLSKRMSFFTAGTTFSVNGEVQSYTKYIKLAQAKIPGAFACDSLQALYNAGE